MTKERNYIIPPTFRRNDARGDFTEIVNEGPWQTVIHGTMKVGSQMGNHYHKENRAFFYLVSGRAKIVMKHLVDQTTDEVDLVAGNGIYFMPFEVHTIDYLEDSSFILLKSYRYREDSPDIFVE